MNKSKENSEENELKQFFGFIEFETTKEKSHVDSDLSAVFKSKSGKHKYRQFMNRRGGFNRVLDNI